MGMYDTFVVKGSQRELFVSAEGNIVDHLQTKCFDCGCDTYVLHDGRLFLIGSDRQRVRELVCDDGILELHEVVRCTPFHAASARVYSFDERALPVLAISERGGGSLLGRYPGDQIQGHQPWCEWIVEFDDGALKSVVPDRLQTRAEVRAELMKREWLLVLDDDNPISIRHFELLEERGD